MDYARFGSTGLTVSRLCLGCMTYGDPSWREWVLDEEASRPFIREALESGINFFDTADMYSLGRSEEVLGRALKDMARRDEVVIARWDRSPTRTASRASTSWRQSTPR
jgi:1-deoxyxylulose-5-phosphate synthase